MVSFQSDLVQKATSTQLKLKDINVKVTIDFCKQKQNKELQISEEYSSLEYCIK
jgi:hypothetical protein